MKKFFIILLSVIVLTVPLIATVSASESSDYAFSTIAYFNSPGVSGANADFVSSTYYFDNVSHLGSIPTTVTDLSGFGVYITSERLRSDTGQFFTTLNWAISSTASQSDSDLVIPDFSYIYFDGVSYPLTYNNNIYSADFGNINFQMSVNSNGDTLTFQVIVLYRYYYSSGSLFLPIDLSFLPLNSSGSQYVYNFIGYTPTIISAYDMSNADIVNAINAMANSSSSTSTSVISAITQAGATITQTQVSTAQGITTSVNQVQATTEQVKQAVQIMEQNMSGNVAEGMEQYEEEKEKQEVEKGNAAVQEIIEQIPLVSDINNIKNIFESLIDILSDTSLNCNLTFPAGNVSIAGESFTFWDSQEIDMNSVFANEHIQLLLVAFRFIFGFGFIRYLLHWINKIIGAVFMEDKSTEGDI